jgi:hypothetical protein
MQRRPDTDLELGIHPHPRVIALLQRKLRQNVKREKNVKDGNLPQGTPEPLRVERPRKGGASKMNTRNTSNSLLQEFRSLLRRRKPRNNAGREKNRKNINNLPL